MVPMDHFQLFTDDHGIMRYTILPEHLPTFLKTYADSVREKSPPIPVPADMSDVTEWFIYDGVDMCQCRELYKQSCTEMATYQHRPTGTLACTNHLEHHTEHRAVPKTPPGAFNGNDKWDGNARDACLHLTDKQAKWLNRRCHECDNRGSWLLVDHGIFLCQNHKDVRPMV